MACWIRSVPQPIGVILSVPDWNTLTSSVHAKRSLSIFKLTCSIFRGQQVVISSEGNAWAAAELAAEPCGGPDEPSSAVSASLGGVQDVPTRSQTHRRILRESSAEEIKAYREVVELGGKRRSSSQSGSSGSHIEENPWTGQTDCLTGNNNYDWIRWPNGWPCSMTSFMVNRCDSRDQTSPVPVSVHWRNGVYCYLLVTLIKLNFLDTESTKGFLWLRGFLLKKKKGCQTGVGLTLKIIVKMRQQHNWRKWGWRELADRRNYNHSQLTPHHEKRGNAPNVEKREER